MDKEESNYENKVTFKQKENGVTNSSSICETKEDNKKKIKIEEKIKILKNNKEEQDKNSKNVKMFLKEKTIESLNKIDSVIVHLLNGGKFECSINSKSTGLDVFKKTCDYLILREHEYFGLTYLDAENVRIWVNLEKKILKQIKDNINSLHFEVKFFPEPADLKENITRYFLTLQIRNNILNEKISCSSETYALLGSYLVQSELGNYDPDKHGKDYLKDFKFTPNPSLLLTARLVELHKQRKGQTSAEADLAFLQNAKKLSIYGLDFYPAKDSNDSDITIGVCSSGLSVYKNKIVIEKFPWPKIMKISYMSNNFYIKVKSCESEENENTIGFKLSSSKAAKGLWQVTVDHHTFFKSLSGGSSSKNQSKVSFKNDLKSSKNSKHTHSKSQKDVEKSTSSSTSKHYRDHLKTKKDEVKTSDKYKKDTSSITKSKENRSHHHLTSKNHHSENHRSENHRSELNRSELNRSELNRSENHRSESHHSENHHNENHKRKREDKSHHHKEHHDSRNYHHETDTSNKDYKNRSENKKYSSSNIEKNKKYKHKHNCDLGKKLTENQKSSNKDVKNYEKQKHKPESSHQNHHKHHKSKKPKRSSETKLSPSFDESKYQNKFVEDLSTNNPKKSSSHFIRDIINLENDYAEVKNLPIVDQVDRLETTVNENFSDNNDNYNEIINIKLQTSSTCTITNKPGSPPKKDVKLVSKSNVEFDIFWDNEKSEETFKTENVSNNSKNLDDNVSEEDLKSNNIKGRTSFIPRVLLNGNSSTNNSTFLSNNNNNQQQNMKSTTAGPKTPDEFSGDHFGTNTLSNQSLNSPIESQNKTLESNNSPLDSLNANSIKSLSPTSQNNSESNSNNQSSSKNKLTENHHSTNSNNALNLKKQEVYDPEAPLESPENNQSIDENDSNDFIQDCSETSEKNNQIFENNSYNQNGNSDTVVDMEIDSPYSPPQQSSPVENPNPMYNIAMNLSSHFTAPALKAVLDHLIKAAQLQQKNQVLNKAQQASTLSFKKPAPVPNSQSKSKILNKKIILSNECLDEMPSSAVELRIRENYIKKLNRQERVVEELKCSLKPFYQKREINKEEYKQIMRKAVPKICHSKTGEINPVRIKHFVESYINKLKHLRKSNKTKT